MRLLPSVSWRCDHGEHVHVEGTPGLHPACECPREPTGVLHSKWINALAADRSIDAGVVGQAVRFCRGTFTYQIGKQHTPQTASLLVTKWGQSESSWKRFTKTMRERGWFTQFATVPSEGPRPTPMYLLTIPDNTRPGPATASSVAVDELPPY